ncbi:MAG: ABC transporter permease [Geminicoccaceae bacterium]
MVALSALPWLVLVLLWAGEATLGIVNPALLPPPGQVATEAWRLAVGGTLWPHLFASTARVLAGVAIGTALAVPAAFLLARVPMARLVLEPMLNFFRALPPIALIPLVILYFGIGEGAKLIVLSLGAFYASVIVLFDGIVQLPPIYAQVARTLGADEREIFVQVVLPQTIPSLLTALRVALGVTWATVVAAELIAAQRGLGAMIQIAASFFQLKTILVGIIAIGVCALLMDWLLRAVSARLLRWQDRTHP